MSLLYKAPKIASKTKLTVLSLALLMGTSLVSAQTDPMTRSDRLFIKHGIQYQSWVGSPTTTDAMPYGTEYTGLNFTAPTWFSDNLFNSDFFNEFPTANWSIEKAPYTIKNAAPPTPSEVANGFLSAEQAPYANQLVSIGLGDEEHYSNSLVLSHIEWIDLIKNHYPETLVHNNQWGSQWTHTQIRDYMTRANPDFISYDTYYYRNTSDNGRKLRELVPFLLKYRNLAYEDNATNGPINFGFYLQGFKINDYALSETQIKGHAYMPLLFGAKWLNVFRYFKNTQGKTFFYHNPDGTPSPIYGYFADVGAEVESLSPHLSRLKSSQVTIVPGQYRSNGSTYNLGVPSGTTRWSSAHDRYITDIEATNLGTLNNGLDGDIYVGYFNPVDGLNSTANITMAPVPHEDTEYFMILNGLSVANTTNSITNPVGTADTARQTVRLTIDFGNDPIDNLKRINRTTGVTETLTLTHVFDSQYYIDLTLDGGNADLFYWENAHIPVVEPDGNSVELAGSDSIVTSNVSELNGATNFTIESWIKFDTPISGWNGIWSQSAGSTSRIQLWAVQGNQLVVGVANGQNTTKNSSTGVFNTGQWHHVAVTYNGATSGKLKLYVDGVERSLSNGLGTIPSTAPSNSGSFKVHGSIGGKFDEIRIWSSTLSSSTIDNWKNRELGNCHPNASYLELYWKLDGTSSTAEAGLSTNYTGNLSNGVLRVDEGKAATPFCPVN